MNRFFPLFSENDIQNEVLSALEAADFDQFGQFDQYNKIRIPIWKGIGEAFHIKEPVVSRSVILDLIWCGRQYRTIIGPQLTETVTLFDYEVYLGDKILDLVAIELEIDVPYKGGHRKSIAIYRLGNHVFKSISGENPKFYSNTNYSIGTSITTKTNKLTSKISAFLAKNDVENYAETIRLINEAMQVSLFE